MHTASNPRLPSLPQMANATSLMQQISVFCSEIHNRCYDEGTVRILESILESKDVKSLIGVRSAVKQFMRDESLVIIREITEESVELKLLCIDFLIRVFALIGDVESCLALRYEALVMREQKTTTFHGLQVSFEEWLIFAEHSVEKGFNSIASQACDKALNRWRANHETNSITDEFSQELQVIKKIKKLKDAVVLSVSSQSVQAQAARYLRQKAVEQSAQQSTISVEAQCSGSLRFRNGIKKRNLQRLQEYRRL